MSEPTYTPTLDWVSDPRVQLLVTGTVEDGAAVGHDSTRLHWCRVVCGGRTGEFRYYRTASDAIREAEAVLAELRAEVEAEREARLDAAFLAPSGLVAGVPEHARSSEK